MSISKVSFGVFDWVDRGTQPLSQLYEDRLQLLAAADEAGFFCYHLAEHHATPLGMAPSPALFLTAATQRTRRIRLGPLVYLLPLYDPLRLIEEVAMLDQLSGGRLERGVGRGVSPYELRNLGVDPENSRAMFDEALAVLLAGLTRERLSFAGTHYQYLDVPIELHSLQQPYPPLWYPTHTPGSIEYAGRHGFNFVGLGPAAAVREHTDAYKRAWSAHRHDPDRLNGHVPRQKSAFCASSSWPTATPTQKRRRARHIRCGFGRLRSCGMSTTTTASTACSRGRRRSGIKASSSDRRTGCAARCSASQWRVAATT
jgi:alkanesulfonate monooxygenase SsuD/methylene tetrahydromethanopterin reductase-like flavin-dependent oxidoreductase (luciferase family)